MTTVIEVRRLAKYYGRVAALRDLSLTAEAGEFITLFGRNGAGKTTLLRILAGLTRPSSGTFTIKPAGAGAPRFIRGAIGYLSHSTALYADLTALENMRFYARLMEVADGEDALVRRIEDVGLAGREREPIRNYSRGMQQRLAIARAFLHSPGILLLDEPFTGLDQAGSDFLRSYLMKARSEGKACIMTIHDIRAGYEMADRLVVINRGTAALDVSKASLTPEAFQEQYRRITETAN
ncbi:MAG: heme ABC exporter ATP-binding protein CcmA [Acidobacteria bacterium]|nr:heme ABC exporter ATP-binding protein CcmA [Acidobacteriota bacterium]